MHRLSYSGDPSRGPAYGNQDARSNLAVQPAATTMKINLKKAAIKVVGPASGVGLPPSKPPQPAAAQMEPKKVDAPTSPAPKLSRSDEKEITSSLLARLPKSPAVKTSPRHDAEASLDAMFARLTSPEPLVYAMPTLTKERAAESSRVVETPTKAPIVPKAKEAEDNGSPAGVEAGDATIANTSRGDLESQYLSKALEYFISVPTMEGSQVGLIQSIASGFQPSISADKLKCEIVKATMSYLNTLPKDSSSGPVDYDLVEKALNDSKGNFLHLCALFVNEQLLAIETLDHVVGLCKAVIRVLPGDEKAKAEPEKPVTNDPMDKMPAWPSQEKRENVPGCRTVILKGVGHVTNINQLQSLVWGGRLESIHLPEPGKESAMVKFLTPEGCQRYFDATENGIEIPGDKTKSLIFVERNSAPNSINDVLRNCTEGDATRCVRALDADDDWSDMVLLKLARGQGKVKREIDRIKRGRTNKGRYFIEFRFASIYHALNFKRELMDDEDWEHCLVGYAADPCEAACGVHIKDEDE